MRRNVRRTTAALTVGLVVFLGSCTSLDGSLEPALSIVHHGILECFAPGYSAANGKPVSCETSAVERIGSRVLLISDKETPDAQATQGLWFDAKRFRSESIPHSLVRYDRRRALLDARKIEGLAASQDGRWIFATSAFDRPSDPGSAESDAYDSLLYWSVRRPQDVKVAQATADRGVVSSIALRGRFASALADASSAAGPPYFKIEGLTTLPGDRLLFGVREMGLDYDHFDYVVALVETRYTIEAGELQLDEKFRNAVRLRLSVPEDPAVEEMRPVQPIGVGA